MADQAGAAGFRWTARVRFGDTDPYGDVLQIRVAVDACTERSVTFAFRIGRESDGEPLATGEIACAAIDAAWHPVALPPEWRERLLDDRGPPTSLP